MRKTLESVLHTYQTVSNDFVRRYQHVANLNALPFDSSRETAAAKAFSEILSDGFFDFLRDERLAACRRGVECCSRDGCRS